MSKPRFNLHEGWVRLGNLGAVLEHNEPLPTPLAIKCCSVAGSSAQRRHASARWDEDIAGAYLARAKRPRIGLIFFAFDLVRLNDVFVGQFTERCLRLCIAQRGSVCPAFGGLMS